MFKELFERYRKGKLLEILESNYDEPEYVEEISSSEDFDKIKSELKIIKKKISRVILLLNNKNLLNDLTEEENSLIINLFSEINYWYRSYKLTLDKSSQEIFENNTLSELDFNFQKNLLEISKIKTILSNLLREIDSLLKST